MEKTALISPCGRYRYRLTRRWGPREWVSGDKPIMEAPSDHDLVLTAVESGRAA